MVFLWFVFDVSSGLILLLESLYEKAGHERGNVPTGASGGKECERKATGVSYSILIADSLVTVSCFRKSLTLFIN